MAGEVAGRRLTLGLGGASVPMRDDKAAVRTVDGSMMATRRLVSAGSPPYVDLLFLPACVILRGKHSYGRGAGERNGEAVCQRLVFFYRVSAS